LNHGPARLKLGHPDADHQSMSTRVPNYDPSIIEIFAERLYAKAAAFVMGSVVVGGALGAALGAVPLTSLGASWPVPSSFGFATMLVGGLAGAVVGYFIGETRSFSYKLQAQSALCQLQIERNAAAVAERAAVPTPAPAPPPAPVQQAAPAPAGAPRPPAPPAAEPELRPVVVPPDAQAVSYGSLLRVATPLDE
jgi:hypothetical protein